MTLFEIRVLHKLCYAEYFLIHGIVKDKLDFHVRVDNIICAVVKCCMQSIIFYVSLLFINVNVAANIIS